MKPLLVNMPGILAPLMACAIYASPPNANIPLLSQLEASFLARNLGQISLPAGVEGKLVIEHSLIPPPEGLESASFKKFANAELWLRAKEHNEDLPPNEFLPRREVRTGRFVNPMVFVYDNMGISHNCWYLSRVYFKIHNGKPYISKIVIYDGD